MIAFDAFLRHARGHDPYPWQRALAERLSAEASDSDTGPRPVTIAVPTGSGKTTVVDVLVWALAVQADRLPAERTVGTRIVWAIDRRLLVDEVHEAADTLAQSLADALADEAHPLHDMAQRLEGLKGQPHPDDHAPPSADAGPDDTVRRGTPLVATRWRGGVASPALMGHPLQPEVITSTVAQIGSRLLFRGYGLGDRSLPLGASLAGCDTTICLDEAHLAEPFADTIAAVQAQRREHGDTLAPPVRLIRLSATPGEAKGTVVDDGDLPIKVVLTAEDEADPGLAVRLQGPKHAELVLVEGTADKDQEAALLLAIDGYLEDGRRTIACVVNSVRTARAIFDRLDRRKERTFDAILLIGPQRQADRVRVLDEPLVAEPGAEASATPTPREVLLYGSRAPRPLIVVATQTFEVGLDADVEALVTQSASASSLAQRLGRLNRTGRLNVPAHAAGSVRHPDGHATIVRHVGFPLYEHDEEEAWAWLNDRLERNDAGIDVSVSALQRCPPPPPRQRPHAAELTDQVLELLTQTNPRPARHADPDVDAFLRGAESKPESDVTLCWRADLCGEDDSPGADAYREALLRLAPPRPEEQLTLSIGAARNLLRIRTGQAQLSPSAQRKATSEVTDVEGSGPAQELWGEEAPFTHDGIPFLVRRGRDLLRGRQASERALNGTLRIGDLRPGDLVILPTTLGGVDRFGLAIESSLGRDVAGDVRRLPASTTTNPGDWLHPIRLTRGALDEAFTEAMPRGGPRAQRVRRVLRRVATIEWRIDAAQTPAGRTAALRDLVTELHDHPTASAVDPSAWELRRITPDLPAELTEPGDDPLGLFLEEPTGAADADLVFGDLGDPSTMDPQDGEQFDEPATSDGSDPPTINDRAAGVLLPGEDQPMASGGWVLVPTRRTAHDRVRPRTEAPPTLAAHAQDVTRRAGWFARAAGLSDELVRTIELAARVHDHGKADPRMQAFFHGGTAPPLAEPIAKSVFGTDDRCADRTARATSGLPNGWRHELASAAVLVDAWGGDAITGLPELPGRGVDLDLALGLTTGHHGYTHPLPPVPGAGAAPRSFHVDVEGVTGTATGSDVEGWDDGAPLRRIERLTARYGVWTLAYLQSLLVLADRTVSAEGH